MVMVILSCRLPHPGIFQFGSLNAKHATDHGYMRTYTDVVYGAVQHLQQTLYTSRLTPHTQHLTPHTQHLTSQVFCRSNTGQTLYAQVTARPYSLTHNSTSHSLHPPRPAYHHTPFCPTANWREQKVWQPITKLITRAAQRRLDCVIKCKRRRMRWSFRLFLHGLGI
jgi:hypothetical protein